MLKVIFQKNVNVHGVESSYSCTHTDFFNSLKTDDVKEFVFRPTNDMCDLDLVSRRVKKVENAGFTVYHSGDVHYCRRAIKN